MSEILANEWKRRGHEVIIVTATSSDSGDKYSYPVVRNPRLKSLIKLTSWCDIVYQNNISLKLLWPNLLLRKPTVVTVQTWIGENGGASNWMEFMKTRVHRHCTCVSISGAVARYMPMPSTILGNPYRDDIFRLRPAINRNSDLIFVGRLVSDKGL